MIDLEVTDRYRVRQDNDSFIIYAGGSHLVLRGADALNWYSKYHQISLDHLDPSSKWYDKSWNECLAHIIDPLFVSALPVLTYNGVDVRNLTKDQLIAALQELHYENRRLRGIPIDNDDIRIVRVSPRGRK